MKRSTWIGAYAVIGAALLLGLSPDAVGQEDRPDEGLVRAREVFGDAMRAQCEDFLSTAGSGDRAMLAERFGCEEKRLPEVLGAFMLDNAWADEVLDVTAEEAAAMRAGTFDDAGNRERFEERVAILEELDIGLPRPVTRLIERRKAGKLEGGADLELGWRMLDIPVRKLRQAMAPEDAKKEPRPRPEVPAPRGEGLIRANESAAISGLRGIVTHQALFKDTDRDGDGAANFARTLADLGVGLDQSFPNGERQGYRFRLETAADRGSYAVHADPIEPGKTGRRHFFVDQTGVIRHATDGPADRDSDPVGG